MKSDLNMRIIKVYTLKEQKENNEKNINQTRKFLITD